jgi:microcystin-dependent protein
MSEITLGEIRLFPYPSKVPTGWMPCEGQILQIQQYQALYALLYTRFGGNGTTTFALPDLRGRTPIHYGHSADPNRIGSPGGINIGTATGSETVTLGLSQIMAHNHTFVVEPTNATGATVANSLPSTSTKTSTAATAPAAPNLYAAPGTTTVPLNPAFITPSGSSQGHENRQPYLPLRFCICVSNGYFPQRN